MNLLVNGLVHQLTREYKNFRGNVFAVCGAWASRASKHHTREPVTCLECILGYKREDVFLG